MSEANKVRKDVAGRDSNGCRNEERCKLFSISGSTQQCEIGPFLL